MQRLTDDQLERLARAYAGRVRATAPDWTDENDADPGITLVELLEFLGESLLERADQIPERARPRLRDVLDRLAGALSVPCPGPVALTRVRYFSGQLLTSEDFEAEQTYLREKHRRHNLLLHGVGVVSGLEVSVEPTVSGHAVSVARGVAIAPDGEELVVCEPVTTELAGTRSPRYVTLSLAEREVRAGPDGEPQRVEESAQVAVLEDVPPGQLAIARLEPVGAGWRVDRSPAARQIRAS